MRIKYLTLLFLFVFLPMGNTAYADCVLAGTAVCDGVACPGKTFKAGQMIYNSDHAVLQICLADNTWKGLHRNSSLFDPCTISSTVGIACADGQTVYAGTWNGNRYYTTKNDETLAPPTYYGAYNVNLGANARSLTDGLTNTNTALAYIEANPQTGTCTDPQNPPACTPNAHLSCKALRTSLGGNWYLPAYNEILNVLYANRVAIGGFYTTMNYYYWTSTESSNTQAYVGNFSSGGGVIAPKNGYSALTRVRCVKRS